MFCNILYTVLPTARHRCGISSKGAVLPGRNDAEMGPANSLHASAYYSEYNERFDLMFCTILTIMGYYSVLIFTIMYSVRNVSQHFAVFDNMDYYLVLISVTDFKFNFTQTKFAMLVVSRPSPYISVKGSKFHQW